MIGIVGHNFLAAVNALLQVLEGISLVSFQLFLLKSPFFLLFFLENLAIK